ncbi:MAG: LysR family transcriptional regulator [Comamonas sp.]
MKNSPQPERLPPLKSLQVFEAAARHGSVARAADELHVTQGAVSRQVRQLEESLGLALFERRNRGVHLTAQGAQLQQACTQALHTLSQAVDALRHQVDVQPLVLSCEPTLAMHWLIPRLASFQAMHPQITLHLVAAGGEVDFVRDRIDLAVRRSDIALQPDWQVDAIAPEWVGPVATPAVAQQWLAPPRSKKQAVSIAQPPLHLLHSRTRPQAWPHWLSQCGSAQAATAPWLPMWLEHFYLCMQAAQSGLGVAMASVYMADAAVCSGSLLAPCGWQADGSQYVLVRPQRLPDVRADAVLSWLAQAMADTLALHTLRDV